MATDGNEQQPNDHFVFGYGSLISASSRARTAPPNDRFPHLPVRAHTLRRMWSIRSRSRGCTALGCVQVDGCCDGAWNEECPNVANGVVFYLGGEVEMRAYGEREGSEYIRTLLPPSHLQSTSPSLLPSYLTHHSSRIWVYVHPDISRAQLPTVQFPIAQTYLDVVLAGCLEIGEGFAEEFVRSTWFHTSAQVSPAIRTRHCQPTCSTVCDGFTRTPSQPPGNCCFLSSMSSVPTPPSKPTTTATTDTNTQTCMCIPWVDDRQSPRYIRWEPDAPVGDVDKLLRAVLGEHRVTLRLRAE
ncbi:hypothetical protein M427DRAFT_158553 [Gonapodya prolifera JEL478]|uniref:Gamma-glutamylcyclotransferase AIG2-like domain-containing protein n=1 Tax=Gonapodya prolifera (strain JEL478) TaxID=1344416 RepID=A0A139A2S6_GONPJ|nr:hypothetical protein M427DRAFT_158553 [Gonapodya prolifera JEL478]|eukprot:KXS11090.1 hypothetical protein M427DRAFT_158553 [Gonapodya prolifera JEL478]